MSHGTPSPSASQLRFQPFLRTCGAQCVLYPDISLDASSPRSPVRVQTEAGCLLQAGGLGKAEAPPHSGQRACGVCPRCFLQVQERGKPKERTLAACRPGVSAVLPRTLETLHFSASPYPGPAQSHSGCQARGRQAGWMQKQQVVPPVSWFLTTTRREAWMLT